MPPFGPGVPVPGSRTRANGPQKQLGMEPSAYQMVDLRSERAGVEELGGGEHGGGGADPAVARVFPANLRCDSIAESICGPAIGSESPSRNDRVETVGLRRVHGDIRETGGLGGADLGGPVLAVTEPDLHRLGPPRGRVVRGPVV